MNESSLCLQYAVRGVDTLQYLFSLLSSEGSVLVCVFVCVCVCVCVCVVRVRLVKLAHR